VGIPKAPTIYEIFTPVFLHEVSQRAGEVITLATVPDAEWGRIARPGIDTVWLMGVWSRSVASQDVSKSEQWLHDALPDMKNEDILGSAYSVQSYRVDERFGGDAGLAAARRALKQRGISLILDFVPNHVAMDNEWVASHPEYFIGGSREELREHPEAFVETASGIFAKGKDPHYDPWSDVVQLNAFSAPLRAEAAGILQRIATMADGVRCDMAMLMMNTIFIQTWGERAGDMPADDYWSVMISGVKASNPDFIFIAEAYWDTQQTLIDQGFDLCYDKGLYDALIEGSVGGIKRHLQQPIGHQQQLLRFIENHDEPRAAVSFSYEKHLAAAVITATLPGAHLYHDGEREGRRIRVPVQLGRRVDEFTHEPTALFYDKLWEFIDQKELSERLWKVLPARSHLLRRESRQVLAWTWTGVEDRFAFVVNYTNERARVNLRFDVKTPKRLLDIVEGESNVKWHGNGSRLVLEPWQHVIIEY
jgi:hypothetical protein